MDWWLLPVIAAAIVAISYVIFMQLKRATMSDYIARIPGYTFSKQVVGVDGKTGIAIDESRRTICLIDNQAGHMDARVVDFRGIISSEIVVDSTVITRTSRSSQIGGAIVGGALFGVPGAIIGGLSGSTHSSNMVSRIDLNITVNDTSKPLYRVAFLTSPTPNSGFIYRNALDQAQHWHALITVLIKRTSTV